MIEKYNHGYDFKVGLSKMTDIMKYYEAHYSLCQPREHLQVYAAVAICERLEAILEELQRRSMD